MILQRIVATFSALALAVGTTALPAQAAYYYDVDGDGHIDYYDMDEDGVYDYKDVEDDSEDPAHESIYEPSDYIYGSPGTYDDEYYQEAVLDLIKRVDSRESVILDNENLSEAQVDFRAYISHACFHPTEIEKFECEQQFGPYFNLYDTLIDGTLETIIRTRFRDTPQLYALLTALRREQRNMTDGADEELSRSAEIQAERRSRTTLLWQTCLQNHDYSYADSARCYLRNERLILDLSTPFNSENIY